MGLWNLDFVEGSHNLRRSRAPCPAGELLPCRGTAEAVWRNTSAQVAPVLLLQTDCQPVQEGIAAVTLSPAPLPPSHGHSANCLQANVNHSHPSTRADQGERQSQQPPSLGWLCSKDTWITRKETQNSVFSKRPISFTWAPMAQIPHAEVPEERAGAQGLELLPVLGSGSRAGAHPGSLMSTGLKPGITSR